MRRQHHAFTLALTLLIALPPSVSLSFLFGCGVGVAEPFHDMWHYFREAVAFSACPLPGLLILLLPPTVLYSRTLVGASNGLALVRALLRRLPAPALMLMTGTALFGWAGAVRYARLPGFNLTRVTAKPTWIHSGWWDLLSSPLLPLLALFSAGIMCWMLREA